jgi:hypothetical protein
MLAAGTLTSLAASTCQETTSIALRATSSLTVRSTWKASRAPNLARSISNTFTHRVVTTSTSGATLTSNTTEHSLTMRGLLSQWTLALLKLRLKGIRFSPFKAMETATLVPSGSHMISMAMEQMHSNAINN